MGCSTVVGHISLNLSCASPAGPSRQQQTAAAMWWAWPTGGPTASSCAGCCGRCATGEAWATRAEMMRRPPGTSLAGSCRSARLLGSGHIQFLVACGALCYLAVSGWCSACRGLGLLPVLCPKVVTCPVKLCLVSDVGMPACAVGHQVCSLPCPSVTGGLSAALPGPVLDCLCTCLCRLQRLQGHTTAVSRLSHGWAGAAGTASGACGRWQNACAPVPEMCRCAAGTGAALVWVHLAGVLWTIGSKCRQWGVGTG